MAKLIDPDHPIISGDVASEVARPGNVMDYDRYEEQNKNTGEMDFGSGFES